MTIVKTYGIVKNCMGRYAVSTDISEDKTEHDDQYRLSYANPEFALRKAEAFVRHCYKDFVNFQGIAIHFEFINMGLIN